MNILTAAQRILNLVLAKQPNVLKFLQDSIGNIPLKALEGRSVEHAVWLLSGITLGYIQGGKADRWLCYAQDVLITQDCLTQEEATIDWSN